MTIKQYQGVRIAIAIMLAVSISISMSNGNYIAPVIGIIAAIVLLTVARRQVKDVLADERDYELGGKAARWSITIFACAMMFAVFILFSLKDRNPEFANIASLLAYLTCGLMLLNSVLFSFFRYKQSGDRKGLIKEFKHYLPFIILAIVAALVIAVASLRMFTPEDEWMCDNGQWTQHGNPDSSMPAEPCR